MTAAALILPIRETLTGGESPVEETPQPSPPPVANPTPDPPSPPPIIFKDLTEQDDSQTLSIGDLLDFRGGLRALGGNDSIIGSSGSEQVNGNAGLDTLFGRTGNDVLLGGRDSDRLFGEEGNDILNGNRGTDLVVGGEDNDVVRGGQDDDVLIGSAGNDTLIGDFGQDLLFGGAGQDVYVLRTDAAQSNPDRADLLFNFNPSEDSIGLTNGLTANDITLEIYTIDITTQFSIFDLFPDETSIVSSFSNELVNPEGTTTVNATAQGVLIRNNQAGSVLGIAIGVTPADISSRFVTVSQNILTLG